MGPRVASSVLATFERRVKAALAKASLFEIGSYGWLNDEDPDPTLVGHAMWQLRERNLDAPALLGEAPLSRRPDELDKAIQVAGEDFCGLTLAARWSIGLALVWKTHGEDDPFNEQPFFWVHHTDAFLKLAIASQRIRDLLILACTGGSVRAYYDVCRQERKRPNIFGDAARLLASRGLNDGRLDEALAALPRLGLALGTFVEQRNEIVHDVATRMAKFTRDSLAELQERYDQEEREGFSPIPVDAGDWLATGQAHDAALRAEVDRAAGELREWYLLLVQASNCVFQVEYWSRTLGRRQDTNK